MDGSGVSLGLLGVIVAVIVLIAILIMILRVVVRRARYAAVGSSTLGRVLLESALAYSERVQALPRVEWFFREQVSTLGAFSKDWQRWLDRQMKERREEVELALQVQPQRAELDAWITKVFAEVASAAERENSRTRRILKAIADVARRGGGDLYGLDVPDARRRTLIAQVWVNYTSPAGKAHRSAVVSISAERLTAVAAVARKPSVTDLHRGAIPNTLRIAVLRRDEYRCQMCGRSSKTDGVALEVDHIQPSSLGGPTVDWNLQTLCRDCNRGKGNRFVG